MDPVEILVIHPASAFGGAERHTVDLVHHLHRDERHRVALVQSGGTWLGDHLGKTETGAGSLMVVGPPVCDRMATTAAT